MSGKSEILIARLHFSGRCSYDLSDYCATVDWITSTAGVSRRYTKQLKRQMNDFSPTVASYNNNTTESTWCGEVFGQFQRELRNFPVESLFVLCSSLLFFGFYRISSHLVCFNSLDCELKLYWRTCQAEVPAQRLDFARFMTQNRKLRNYNNSNSAFRL